MPRPSKARPIGLAPFFARHLRLPQASVTIAAGARSRRKLIRITGCPSDETAATILALASAG